MDLKAPKAPTKQLSIDMGRGHKVEAVVTPNNVMAHLPSQVQAHMQFQGVPILCKLTSLVELKRWASNPSAIKRFIKRMASKMTVTAND